MTDGVAHVCRRAFTCDRMPTTYNRNDEWLLIFPKLLAQKFLSNFYLITHMDLKIENIMKYVRMHAAYVKRAVSLCTAVYYLYIRFFGFCCKFNFMLDEIDCPGIRLLSSNQNSCTQNFLLVFTKRHIPKQRKSPK